MKIRVSVPAGLRVPLPPPDGRVLTAEGQPEGGWIVEHDSFIDRRIQDELRNPGHGLVWLGDTREPAAAEPPAPEEGAA